MIQNIVTGKLGEIAVYRMSKEYELPVGRPDFTIYDSKKKSFDADLSSPEFQIHVKSQGIDSANKYGISWILQFSGNGRGHQDKLFRRVETNDYLAPCLVKDTTVHIYGIIKVKKLFLEDMIEEPKNPWFVDTKRAIYFDKIRTLPYYHRWGIVPAQIER